MLERLVHAALTDISPTARTNLCFASYKHIINILENDVKPSNYAATVESILTEEQKAVLRL